MKNFLTLIGLFLIAQNLCAQLPETFDLDLNGWTVNNPNANWYHSDAGTALSHNWDNRPPINSPTNTAGSGAAVFNGDSLSAAGSTATVFTLTSPILAVGGLTNEKPGLIFNQYYKNFAGSARVEISTDGGMTWAIFPVNQSVGNFMETPPDDFVFLDISSVALNEPELQIRFAYEGAGGFWIIDDVDLVSNVAQFTPTFPPALADTLCAYAYPFHSDSEGGAYPPDELVVEYIDGTTAAERAAVRQIFQVTDYEYCECDTLELWKNPVVIEPTKVEIADADFPNEGADFNFPEGFNPMFNDCSATVSYGFAFQITDLCETYSPNFTERTTGGTGNSTMLAIRGGVGAGFTVPNINLLADSLYVFSFYGRVLPGTGFPDLEISVGGTPLDTVTLTTDGAAWGRYDVKLDVPTAGGGLISVSQINAGGVYALDDLCLAVYLLGDANIIDINGIKEKAKSCAKVEEIDKNYYNFDFTGEETPLVAVPDIFPTVPTVSAYTDEKVIAVLDTGMDYNFSEDNNTDIDLRARLYYNESNPCKQTDFIGYNFVDTLKTPYDDSRGGHGTHVAGIIEENIRLNPDPMSVCDYKIMPVKTHDTLGIGTLYRVSCGISYAAQRGADYVNASWGYYGEEKDILENVIRNAGDDFDLMVVCSAGNDTTDIGVQKHWPASLDLPKLISVAATADQATPALAAFSNFNDPAVHFGILGENTESAVPPHTLLADATKSGTSMAAPRLTAAAYLTQCHCTENDKNKVRSILRSMANNNGQLLNGTENGRFLDLENFVAALSAADCPVAITETDDTFDLRIFPNPTSDFLFAETDLPASENLFVRILDLTGRVYAEQKTDSSDFRVDVKDLPRGAYFLQIFGEKGQKSIGFVRL